MALIDNLVAYYKMDGNVNDSHGANNASQSGINFAAGKLGSACAEFSSGDSITIGSGLAFASDNYSVSFWFKAASGVGGDFITASVGSSNEDTPVIGISGGNINTQTSRARYSSGPSISCSTVIGGLADSNWHHCVVRCEQTGGTTYLKIFVDGVERASTSIAGDAVNNGINTIKWGSRSWESNATLVHSSDEWGFWSRALTTTEIGQLYNGGAGLAYPLSVGPTNPGAFLQFMR